MRLFTRTAAALLLLLTAFAGRAQGTNQGSFTLAKATEIPGTKLNAGNYTLVVLDSLQDRTVMQVNSTDGKTKALVLGVQANLSGPSGQPVLWDAKDQGRHALRGFVFSNGRSVEFVYPKADAVALAKANHSTVVAVDPASEGRPELNRLSSNDMQMVSLWMLTPTRVSGQDGLEAKHYTPSNASAPQVASSASPASSTGTPQSSTPAPRRSNAGTLVAQNTPPAGLAPRAKRSKPVVSSDTSSAPASVNGVQKLPQTASELPMLLLLSGAGLFGAGMLRARRTV